MVIEIDKRTVFRTDATRSALWVVALTAGLVANVVGVDLVGDAVLASVLLYFVMRFWTRLADLAVMDREHPYDN
jgi:hypothetical protein